MNNFILSLKHLFFDSNSNCNCLTNHNHKFNFKLRLIEIGINLVMGLGETAFQIFVYAHIHKNVWCMRTEDVWFLDENLFPPNFELETIQIQNRGRSFQTAQEQISQLAFTHSFASKHMLAVLCSSGERRASSLRYYFYLSSTSWPYYFMHEI